MNSITIAPASLDLLDAQSVQAMPRVDRSTVYCMAEDGRLPAIKVGRQWRFPAAAIDRWLADQHHRHPARREAPLALVQRVANI